MAALSLHYITLRSKQTGSHLQSSEKKKMVVGAGQVLSEQCFPQKLACWPQK